MSKVYATHAVPPHEHFSQYRDKHKRDKIFWPDDPWKVSRVPAAFKVGFDVVTDEAKGTLQYITMEELDVSKFVEIEYVLGSSENNHRCVHPQFAKMTSYQKGVVEAERPESIGLLPKKASSEVSLLEAKTLEDKPQCAPRGIMCDICLSAVATRLGKPAPGGCGIVDTLFAPTCKIVTEAIGSQENEIKEGAMKIYRQYGPKTAASMLICEDFGCCGTALTKEMKKNNLKGKSQLVKTLDSCLCSYDPKKMRSKKGKVLDKTTAAKYVNQSRARNMVDPIIATPKLYLKRLKRGKRAVRRSPASILKSMSPQKRLKVSRVMEALEDDNVTKPDNFWDEDWKIQFEISTDHGRHWIQLNIPTKFQERQSRVVKRTIAIPALLFKLGRKVKYRFTQSMGKCNCCSDLFVRSFSPKDVDVELGTPSVSRQI
eukprot:g9869.t1